MFFGDSKPSTIFVSNKTKTVVEDVLYSTEYKINIINVDEISIQKNLYQ